MTSKKTLDFISGFITSAVLLALIIVTVLLRDTWYDNIALFYSLLIGMVFCTSFVAERLQYKEDFQTDEDAKLVVLSRLTYPLTIAVLIYIFSLMSPETTIIYDASLLLLFTCVLFPGGYLLGSIVSRYVMKKSFSKQIPD